MALLLVDKVVDFLKNNPNKKFTAREIAEWIYQTYPDQCEAKQKRAKLLDTFNETTYNLIQQIIREIGASRPRIEQKGIKLTANRPCQYYFTTDSDSDEVMKAETETLEITINKTANRTGEHDLYPMLAQYLSQELGIYSMRIDEKRSSNRRGPNGNKWLYPDLVAMEDLSHHWNFEIKNCVKEYFDKKTRLWSFEVKILINSSNLREVFFQAVSNSSWANFGYLVASEIVDSNTLKELRILSSLHGIGLILLNKEDISESQILIPAREKIEVDWNSANRLADENKDFLDFIKQVRHFYQTGNINTRDWITAISYSD